MPAFLNGFLLGASLIIAIGAQNAFILRQGLLKSHVFLLSLICALSDALLIAAGVAGLGTFVSSNPGLLRIVTIGGILFLAWYAFKAFARAAKPEALGEAQQSAMPLAKAVSACLAFTFLNPHVYLDTVVLIGSLSAQYADQQRLLFAIGAMSASFVWFFSLGYGARLLLPLFRKPKAWQVLDIIIGFVMSALALSLAATLF